MSLVDVKYCYILDAVLLLYGFILTVLYCRLRIQSQSQKEEEPRPPKKQAPEAGIYAVRPVSLVIKKLLKKAQGETAYDVAHGTVVA